MPETIQVNFRNWIPLFPLSDTVLLPHAILPLHIFEPRYRQMVSQSLDQSGQIAIGTVPAEGGDESVEPDLAAEPDDAVDAGTTTVRPAACIGQIIQHDVLPDGRYNILLHGVCRARIKQVSEPDGDRAFRLARLVPIEPLDQPPTPLPGVREKLRRLLGGPMLQHLRGIETLMEWIDRDDVPTHALLELIGFALVRDTELKYQLLAEPDAMQRASMIKHELKALEHLVRRTAGQKYGEWPKGVSWN